MICPLSQGTLYEMTIGFFSSANIISYAVARDLFPRLAGLSIHEIDLVQSLANSEIESIDAIGTPVFSGEIDIASTSAWV